MKKLFFVIYLFLWYSCSQEGQEAPEKEIDIESIINGTDTEFIYFEDGDAQYFFPNENFLENISNTYLEELDQLNLTMKNDYNKQYSCDIIIINADILNQQYPYTIDENSIEYTDGYVELQLRDEINYVEVTFGPDDDFNYVGDSSSDQITLTINSLENDVIECSFEGIIKTRTEKQINVQNGQLRISLN